MIYLTFLGHLKLSKDLVAGKMGFLQKVLQFLRGSRGLKPLRRNGFGVSRPANTLQLPGLPGIGPVNNGCGLGDSFPAFNVIA